MPGRKAYPISLLGATNDKRHLSNSEIEIRSNFEPRVESCLLRCPSRLGSEEKREWRRIVQLYRGFDQPILSDLDANALEVYCCYVAMYRKAMKKVRESSEIYISKTDPNNPRKNPWLTVANDAAYQMRKYGEVLLLDPVSRARVGLANYLDATENDPMAVFLMNRPKY